MTIRRFGRKAAYQRPLGNNGRSPLPCKRLRHGAYHSLVAAPVLHPRGKPSARQDADFPDDLFHNPVCYRSYWLRVFLHSLEAVEQAFKNTK